MEKLNLVEIKKGGVEGKKVGVIVHGGVFHADDVLGAAEVIKYYDRITSSNNRYFIIRVQHQSNINEVKEEVRKFIGKEVTFFVVDVGRVYNPDQLMFDHHQYGQNDPEFGHAAAGLLYEFFKEKGVISEFEAEELDDLIKMVDENDLGIYKGPWEGTFPWVVALHNSKDIYSEEQDLRFVDVVKMSLQILSDIEKRAAVKEETYKKLKESKEVLPGVLELPEFLPGWNEIIFRVKEFDKIDLVIWFDENQGTWKVQQVPDAPGSFGRRGRPVPYRDPLPKGCIFLHKGNFFGVFDSKEALLE
jgi:uncharacterized UPF0160 family protein